MLLVFFFCSEIYARPMVYDCFLFLNELELLDIRLHEMGDVVDKFVIVESAETFRGSPKPFNFALHADSFHEFADKIIYIPVNERLATDNAWDREYYQRNQIMRGLIQCQDEDIILISDVDEIVNQAGVSAMCSAIESGATLYAGASQRYHSNYLNSAPGGFWRGTVATTYNLLKKVLPQGIRNIKDSVPVIAGGWHFTWQGGVDRDLYKLGAYSHAESDTPEEREAKRYKIDHPYSCQVVEIDDTFPAYVLQNQEYFESIGFILKPRKE